MNYDPTAFLAAPRVLLEAQLEPLQGKRFQPTGFPNLGAAEYKLYDGTSMLLVESPQSMANRLEAVAWDDAADDLVEPLRGLPYVRTTVDGVATDSIREAHRLNSPFLRGVHEQLRTRAGIPTAKEKEASANVDRRKLAAAVFYYDPNSVLHGVFLEKIVGGARLTRLLSGFIEASNVMIAASGGVKNDRVDPSGKEYGGAAAGYGNVPFSRTEYTAQSITAYFSIDTTMLRGYGLPEAANRLLLALGLWKIRRFLDQEAHLRSACDLRVTSTTTNLGTTQNELPSVANLESEIRERIREAQQQGLFADPAITNVEFSKK